MYGYDLDGIITGDALKAMPTRPRVNPKVHTLGDGLLQTGSMLPDGADAPTTGLKHNSPVTAIAWHPKLAMLASGCTSLCFWTPPPV